jgi:hypothetical protein
LGVGIYVSGASQTGPNILSFIGYLFSTFFAGLIGSFQAFISDIIGGVDNVVGTAFTTFGARLGAYGWAMPLMLIASIGVAVMGGILVLSVGKVIEDVE